MYQFEYNVLILPFKNYFIYLHLTPMQCHGSSFNSFLVSIFLTFYYIIFQIQSTTNNKQKKYNFDILRNAEKENPRV